MSPYNDVKEVFVEIRFPNGVVTLPAEIRYGNHPNKGGYEICLKFNRGFSDRKDDKYRVKSFDGRNIVMEYPFQSMENGGSSSQVIPYTLR